MEPWKPCPRELALAHLQTAALDVLSAPPHLRYLGLKGVGVTASDVPSLPSGCELAIWTGRAPLRAVAGQPHRAPAPR
jgi:hypothetical protein